MANSETRSFRSFGVISAFRHDAFFLILQKKDNLGKTAKFFSAFKLKVSRIIEICINLKLNFIFSLYYSEKRNPEIQ